ncbi:MAG: hypothetical protein IH617_08390, partial [Hydrogenophaga sp.]|nr:hypothetical protein [Hydrogenophaga sp.]
MSENKHILEQARIYFGTHRYLKWPTLLAISVITGLLLSKQLGESVDYWLSKLKPASQPSTKIKDSNEVASSNNGAPGIQKSESGKPEKTHTPDAVPKLLATNVLPATSPKPTT